MALTLNTSIKTFFLLKHASCLDKTMAFHISVSSKIRKNKCTIFYTRSTFDRASFKYHDSDIKLYPNKKKVTIFLWAAVSNLCCQRASVATLMLHVDNYCKNIFSS